MTRPVLVIGTALTLFLFGFPVGLALLAPGTVFYYDAVVYLFDIPLAIATIATIATLATRRWRVRTGAGFLLALAAALAVAWAVDPSPAGLQTVIRLAAAGIIAFGISTLDSDERGAAFAALAALLAIQVGIAVAQIAHRAPLGLIFLGERPWQFSEYASQVGPRGTFLHQYLLAGLALITSVGLVREAVERRRPFPWLVAAGLAALPIGFTFSRAAAVGLFLACGGLLLGVRARPRAYLGGVLALLLGAAIPAAALSDGWSKPRVAGVLGERDVVAEASLALLMDSPVVGIGPGRSIDALHERYTFDPEADRYQPVHDVPLLAAVEGGPVAGAIALVLLGALAWRARGTPVALALFGAFLPYLLVDHFAYTYAQGVVMLGLWAGTLDGLAVSSAGAAPMRTSPPPRTASPPPS